MGDHDLGLPTLSNMQRSQIAWLDRDDEHRWYWVDGNHDNHEFLGHLVDHNGWEEPIPVHHERCLYVPRGCVFQLGGRSCMGFGGAYSVDKEYRKPYRDWWPDEMISVSEMYRAEGVHVDVMFTHDAPCSDVLEVMLEGEGYKRDESSRANRQNLTRIVDEVRPKVLFHGHYHERYRTLYETPEGWTVQVEGIGANLEWVTLRDGKRAQRHSSAIRLGDNVLEVEFDEQADDLPGSPGVGEEHVGGGAEGG